MEERGQALIAAGLRCDALIAPSGCGQCPGEEHEHRASGAALTLCQMSSAAVVVLYKIWNIDALTSGCTCVQSRGSTRDIQAVLLF